MRSSGITIRFQLIVTLHLLISILVSVHFRLRPSESDFLHMSSRNFDGLLFDCDGVIAETERDAHRISFNQAFASQGLEIVWGVEDYGNLLKIGGGKERMRYYFDQGDLWPKVAPTINEMDENTVKVKKQSILKMLHEEKTKLFRSVIESGRVPIRPGGKSNVFLFITNYECFDMRSFTTNRRSNRKQHQSCYLFYV